jgi:MFS family permease
VVLAAAVGFGCSHGIFSMSAGLFIGPMRKEFGWSMSAVAFLPFVTLLVALMQPVGGVLIDRFGPRRVAIFGIFLFASAYVALALLPLSLPLLYLIAACLGALGPTGSAGPYVRGVASWFRFNTGSAFGVTMSGTSLVGVVLLPVVGLAIDRFGWRGGYLILAAIMMGFTLPLVLWLFRENPAAASVPHNPTAPQPSEEEAGRSAGQTFRETLADTRFWLLILALGLAALPMGAYLTHLQPLLRSQQFSLPVAAGYGSLFALAIGIGRIGGGILIDRLWDYAVASVFIAVAAFGCFAITSLRPQDSAWMVAAAVFAIGVSYGAEVDFGAYFALKLFGLRDFPKIFGCVALILGTGVALGGMISSAMVDWTGGYGPLGPVTGVFFLLSAAAMLFMGLRDRRLASAQSGSATRP